MRNRHDISILAAIGFTLAAGVFSGNAAVPKPKVTVTIFPLYEFTAAAAGDRVEVRLMLPPGSDIHSWQPRPRDILSLSESDLLVSVGLDLEPWIHDLAAAGGKSLRIFEAARGLPLIPAAGEHEDHQHDSPHAHEERYDPHVWLDLDLAARIVEAIAGELADLVPGDAEVFAANAERYIRRLRALDERYRETISACRQTQLVVAGHAAFAYLARRYGLEQTSLYGLSPDARPAPKKMIELIEFVKSRNVKAVFTETSVATVLAQTLARETGVRILFLNPGAGLTRAQAAQGTTFLSLMEDNLRILADGLDCR